MFFLQFASASPPSCVEPSSFTRTKTARHNLPILIEEIQRNTHRRMIYELFLVVESCIRSLEKPFSLYKKQVETKEGKL